MLVCHQTLKRFHSLARATAAAGEVACVPPSRVHILRPLKNRLLCPLASISDPMSYLPAGLQCADGCTCLRHANPHNTFSERRSFPLLDQLQAGHLRAPSYAATTSHP